MYQQNGFIWEWRRDCGLDGTRRRGLGGAALRVRWRKPGARVVLGGRAGFCPSPSPASGLFSGRLCPPGVPVPPQDAPALARRASPSSPTPARPSRPPALLALPGPCGSSAERPVRAGRLRVGFRDWPSAWGLRQSSGCPPFLLPPRGIIRRRRVHLSRTCVQAPVTTKRTAADLDDRCPCEHRFSFLGARGETRGLQGLRGEGVPLSKDAARTSVPGARRAVCAHPRCGSPEGAPPPSAGPSTVSPRYHRSPLCVWVPCSL